MRGPLPLGAAVLLWAAAALGTHGADSTNIPPAPNEWVTRVWQTSDGLPQNTVNALAQTRDGYLWIGTSGGLARFDGVRFRTFGLVDGLRSVQILSLHEDARGVLWAGTVGGGVSRWEHGRFTTFAEAEGFPPANAQALAGDGDGTLWVGTERGLTRWRGGEFKMMGAAEGLPAAKQVRALLLDSRGVLWVSVLLDGLYRGTNGQFAPVQRTAGVPGDAYCLAEDSEGSIWAGASMGRVWRWRNGAWTSFGPTNGLPKANIESLAQTGRSPLWVGTRNHGLGIFDGQFHDATQAAGLSGESVHALLVDREGAIWAGTPGAGLHRLSPRVLHAWGTAEGLPQAAVTSIAEGPSGSLWICTPNRGIYQFREGRFSKLEDPDVSGNYPFTYAAEVTTDGSVWVAGEQCLFRFRAGQKTEAFHAPPVKREALRALCADGTNLWLGTYYSTLLKFDGAALRTVATNGSFAGGITSLACEAPDTLWIGASGGLYRWERGSVKSWGTRDGLLTAYIRALHHDADGTLWIGTLGGGLARLKDGRIVNITSRHGLIDDAISQIVPDDFGHLWLGCNRGLMRLERAELDKFAEGRTDSVHPIAFGRNEGMLNEQCAGGHSPTALKTRDGRLLFPTAGGIVEVDPRRLQNVSAFQPQATIGEIVMDGQRRNFESPLVIPPGNHRLEIAYTAPSLRSGEWVRFRTRLEGLDADWVPVGSRRTASYAGLRPGHYTFSVAASDSKGVWNATAASLAIVVQPNFWQTLWFGGFVSVAVGGAAFAWYRGRMAQLETRRLAQMEFTRLLINAQEAERARLARELHDDITQRLARLAIDAGRAGSGDDPSCTAERMLWVRDGLVRLSEDVHSLSYKLHPSLLEDLGLAEAIKAECERFARQESVRCDVNVRDLPEGVPRETAIGLFRVTQEALQNVGRHARATAVDVTLRRLEDGLQLGIRDDGVGFNPLLKRQRISLGLAGMRERMHLLDGELDIESAPGQGTTIVAWVPLKGKGT